MCWAALDNCLKMAERFRRPADTERWTRARDMILEDVMERGWSQKEQALVQHYGGDVLDASLLLAPRVGFIARAAPAGSPPSTRSTSGWSPTAWSTATTRPRPPDGLRGSEARSACAPSCTSTPSPAPAVFRRPATRSRRCTPTPTMSACSRGDRPERRTTGQLSAGVHPSVAHHGGDDTGRGPGPTGDGPLAGDRTAPGAEDW